MVEKISFWRCQELAKQQGLTVAKSRHRGTVRWVLRRKDWTDMKLYLIYPRLRDVHAALLKPEER